MLSKWTYLSVLQHPQDDIHQLVEVDQAGNWIFVYEMTCFNSFIYHNLSHMSQV
jgi:hypothetical protein